MAGIQQLRQKRSGVGLRGWDREQAFDGFTLFTPLAGGDCVYLIDMAGEVVHTWPTPYPPGLYGCLTETGTLLFNGKTREESDRFIATGAWKGGALLEMDWDGRVLWEVNHPDHHHDGIRLRNGNVMLLCMAELPAELAARVQGGLAGSEHNGVMHADYLVEMTLTGDVVWEWRSWEHLDPEVDRIVAVQDRRVEWTHGNAVVELPDGNLMVSFRHTSSVVMISRASGEIYWKLAAPPLAQQHAPTVLDNGNILIFDNGTHRLDHPIPFSRVIEVDPATKEIVWSYQEDYPSQFFSPLISNAQRLPNGNTLICEGSFGRLFEVTHDGEVVWEYINPYFVDDVTNANTQQRNGVFRAFRYSAAEIARARATGGS
ncbi:MAG TPA: aryl sulfotransferase [Chloroflexi bacterium]|jgi:outer membrane protein assembly factor BamB|nr:aryl sulfotransferase [Chloroflexota bacterium]